MKEFILASQSPRRKALLHTLGLDFRCIPARINEDIRPDESPLDAVRKIALRKARCVAGNVDSGLILSADTIVVCDGNILGKPCNREDAALKLKMLSGRDHEVITAVCLMDAKSKNYELENEITRVFFRKITDEEIKAYIATGEPMDKAGAYGIQGLGAIFIKRIEGCYFNVVGLPLTRLYLMLQQWGINLLEGYVNEPILYGNKGSSRGHASPGEVAP
ncbi:Maf family protein [Syntrophomonas erecta]